jgi:hypothetical protein
VEIPAVRQLTRRWLYNCSEPASGYRSNRHTETRRTKSGNAELRYVPCLCVCTIRVVATRNAKTSLSFAREQERPREKKQTAPLG